MGGNVHGPVTRSDSYLGRSRAYAAAAERADHPGKRALLLQMAQHWARLAEIMEKMPDPQKLERELSASRNSSVQRSESDRRLSRADSLSNPY